MGFETAVNIDGQKYNSQVVDDLSIVHSKVIQETKCRGVKFADIKKASQRSDLQVCMN